MKHAYFCHVEIPNQKPGFRWTGVFKNRTGERINPQWTVHIKQQYNTRINPFISKNPFISNCYMG